jgi:hypothetical protein
LNGEFAPAQGLLQALPHGPRVNLTSANEHIPEAERHICTLKERVWSLCHSLHYTKLPPIILTHMVLHCIKLLSYFPPKNSVSDTISPRTLLTGKDFCLPVGAYCQVHEDAAPYNSIIARTKAAICLGPTQNLQVGHYFMALDTGRVVTRYSWTQTPLPQLVLDKVDSWGANQPSLLTFCDRKGRTTGDSNQTTGVNRAEQATHVLDLTPNDSTTPPLHPLLMVEEAHLSEAEIQDTQITDHRSSHSSYSNPNSQ